MALKSGMVLTIMSVQVRFVINKQQGLLRRLGVRGPVQARVSAETLIVAVDVVDVRRCMSLTVALGLPMLP